MENKYLPILFRIEKVMVEEYESNNIATGYSAKVVIDSLAYFYKNGKQKTANLSQSETDLQSKISAELNKILGTKIGDNTVSKESIVYCLNQVDKSIERWSKSNGPTGYFEFVKRYVDRNVL